VFVKNLETDHVNVKRQVNPCNKHFSFGRKNYRVEEGIVKLFFKVSFIFVEVVFLYITAIALLFGVRLVHDCL
jgi:hypothetical protein